MYAHAIPFSSIFHTFPSKKTLLKLKPKNIENIVKKTHEYLPNPPKMGPKSFPGTLLGTLLQMVFLFTPNYRPNGRQMEAQRDPKNR